MLRPLVYNSVACDFSLARGFGDGEVFRTSYASELKECATSYRFMIVSLKLAGGMRSLVRLCDGGDSR